MDELFERIKILEEESKVLENEYNTLDEELKNKRIDNSIKNWLTDSEINEDKKKLEIYNENLNKYKKLIDENISFPANQNIDNVTLPAKLKNPNFNEIEILNFFKLIFEEKKRIETQRKFHLDSLHKQLNLNKEDDPQFYSLVDKFEKSFRGRVINYKNVNYLIKCFDQKEKNIKAMLLYDTNGLKVDESLNDKYKIHHSIEVKDIFENCYILSKEESGEIVDKYIKDNRNFVTIHYQMQADKFNPNEKELIPFKIEPSTIDINQYNLTIDKNRILEVQNKEDKSFVYFRPVFIGEEKGSSGLVSTSLIKVYTTLYNKDILNVLHIHLNDTSQEISIDTVFLEKNDHIENYKSSSIDAMGKRLTYRIIFQDYKLVKIYYYASKTYTHEPPFQEVRYTPNNYVKILNGEYKNNYGQIKDFPIGMLARKDNELAEITRMKSSGFQKEGNCPDRHLEELPGFLSVSVMFSNGNPPKKLKENINISIPVCFLVPLTPDIKVTEEQIKFEKSIILMQEMEIEEANQNIEELYEKCQKYETYIKDENILDSKSLEEVKVILSEVDNIKIEDLEKNSSEEYKVKLDFIKDIKNKVGPVLVRKIRLLKLMGK